MSTTVKIGIAAACGINISVRALTQVPLASLVIRLPANVPERTAEECSRCLRLRTHEGNLARTAPATVAFWAVSQQIQALLADKICLPLSLCLSNKLKTFKIKKPRIINICNTLQHIPADTSTYNFIVTAPSRLSGSLSLTCTSLPSWNCEYKK